MSPRSETPQPKSVVTFDCSALDYLEHADVINKLAWLPLDSAISEGMATLDLKISIGLSLQAAELAGKAMLKSIGCSRKEIRKIHKRHNLKALLEDVQIRLEQHPLDFSHDLSGFLCWTPTIDGKKFRTTIGHYIDAHYKCGAIAEPRAYFYPDEIHFAAPSPPQTLWLIVQELIRFGRELDNLLTNFIAPNPVT